MILKPRVVLVPGLIAKVYQWIGYNPSKGYNPTEVGDLLDVIKNLDLNDTILEVNMTTVMTHPLWLKRFKNVTSIALSLSEACKFAPYVARNSSKIVVGIPWDIPTMKEICANAD